MFFNTGSDFLPILSILLKIDKVGFIMSNRAEMEGVKASGDFVKAKPINRMDRICRSIFR